MSSKTYIENYNIFDIVKLRLIKIELLIKACEKYANNIRLFITENNVKAFDHYNGLINKIRNSYEIIKNLDIKEEQELAKISSMYDHIAIILDITAEVREILFDVSYFNMAYSRMNTIENIHISNAISEVHKAALAFIELIYDDEYSINVAMKGHISQFPEIVLAFINENKDSLNKFIIKLIVNTMDHVTGNNLIILADIAEKHKDAILGAERVAPPAHYFGINELVTMHNLFPDSPFCALKDLMNDYIFVKDESQKILADIELEEIPDKINMDVIILWREAKSNIEFDARGLLSLDYIVKGGMQYAGWSGLNEHIIRRFNTIITRPTPKVEPRHTRVLKARTISDRALVLETYDDKLYRILRRFNDTIDFIDAPRGKDISGTNHVGVDVPVRVDVNTRPEKYNAIVEEKIMAKYADTTFELLQKDYESAKIINIAAESIMKNINDDLLEYFVDAVPAIKSYQDFLRVTLNTNVMMQLVISNLERSINLTSITSPETVIGWIERFNKIAMTLAKTVTKEIKTIVTEITFRENVGRALETHLIDSYDYIIKNSLAELNRLGIWTGFERSYKDFVIERKNV